MSNHQTQYKEPSCKTIFLKTCEERTVSPQQCYKLIPGVNRKVLKVEGQGLFLLSIDQSIAQARFLTGKEPPDLVQGFKRQS